LLLLGAEPSSGFNFNIALYGDEEEEIGGTELAAEWSFSSLQKFGQEFLRKLKGKRMPNKLLEKVMFIECLPLHMSCLQKQYLLSEVTLAK
jgi:hypothetical protein